MAKIDVSFKNNKRERKLYEYFNSLEDKSGDIKKILQDWYDKNVKNTEEPKKTKPIVKDIRDF